MPKQTFYNLSDSKKDIIIQVSIDEFSNYDFNKASINRIVEKSNIAKGSFYQYFDDKLDLYKYIMEFILEKKMKYFDKVTTDNHTRFFEYLRIIFEASMQFAIENPKFSAIADKLYRDDKLREMILGDMETKSHVFMKKLIQKGQSSEDIRENINIDLVTYFLFNLNLSMGELFYKAHDHWNNNIEFQKLTNDIIDILENGIGKK